MKFSTTRIVGLEYIGLPTTAISASSRKKVIGLYVNPDTMETFNRGSVHICEPDLDAMVKTAVAERCLRATLTAEPADVFLVRYERHSKKIISLT